MLLPEARKEARKLLEKHKFPADGKHELLLSQHILAHSAEHVAKALEVRGVIEPGYTPDLTKISEVAHHSRAISHLSREVGDANAHEYADKAARMVREMSLPVPQTDFLKALEAVAKARGDYEAAKRMVTEAEK